MWNLLLGGTHSWETSIKKRVFNFFPVFCFFFGFVLEHSCERLKESLINQREEHKKSSSDYVNRIQKLTQSK